MQLTNVQRAKLRRLLTDAITNVPFYRYLYGDIGLGSKNLADPEVLQHLPILTKDDLRAASLDSRRNERFSTADLAIESTTGSTGQPFSLYLDNDYKRRRNLRFLRALLGAGYRPWHRLMLLTDRYSAPVTQLGRRSYVSVEQPLETMLEAYRRMKPQFLYGFTTPLRMLADRLEASDRVRSRPQAVVSTAEMLDTATAASLEAAFGCPVHDFYGLTEMGLVAWKCAGTAHYNLFPKSVLTEFLPSAGGNGSQRMIMTNLDLRAAPIIRFDSGDLASLEQVDGLRRITHLDGRQIDTIVLSDGTELSPYRVTDALRNVCGLRRFRIVQRAVGRFSAELELDSDDCENATQNVARTLHTLLGPDAQIDLIEKPKVLADGTRKFRPVESQVSRP